MKLLTLALTAVAVVAAVQDAATSTTMDKVDTIMSAVNYHCSVSTRRKRHVVGPSSEDKVRRLVLNVIKDCLEGEPHPTPPAATTTTPEKTTTTSTTTTPTTTSTTTTPTTTSTTTSTTTTPTTTSTTTSTTTTLLPPIAGACSSPNTVNLTGEWRRDNQGSDIKPIDGSYNCDAPLFDNTTWFRITGSGGNLIRNTCSPAYSCGSHGGIWTNATMPSVVGSMVLLPLYGSWAGDCNWYPMKVPTPLTVLKCSHAYGDYVYKIDGHAGCSHSICGME